MSLKDDIPRLQKHLRETLGSPHLKLVMHPKKKDMAEVSVGDEFVATLYLIEEDGEVEYQFQMAILPEDLE